MMKKIKMRMISKKFIIAGVLLIIILLAGIAGRKFFYLYEQDNYNDESGEMVQIGAEVGELRQYFTVSEDVQRFSMLMTNNTGEVVPVTVSIYDAKTDELLASAVSELYHSAGGESVVTFNIVSDNIPDSTEVYLLPEVEGNPPEVQYCVLEGDYQEQYLTINGEDTDYRLRMSVIYQGSYNKAFWALSILLMMSVVFIFFVPRKWAKPENLFLIIAVIAGLTMAVVTPANQECDGPDHLLRSIDTSYGNFLGSFINLTHEGGEIIVPENLPEMGMKMLNAHGGEGVSYTKNLKEHTFSKETMLMPYEGSVTSVVYWPQGIGIWLGRIFGMSMNGCILFGKICNLAVFIILTYLAIRLMPCYKMLLTAVGLLPITLFQASSLSQDSVINGLSFLFIALCFYYAFGEKQKLNWKHMLPLGFLLLGIFLGKYVYACLGLLVFMIPIKKFESKKAYWKSFVIAILPLLLLGGYVLLHNISGISGLQGTSGTGDVTQTQTQFLLNHPKAALAVLYLTLQSQFSSYILQLNMLGSLNVKLEILYVIAPCVIAVVGCIDKNNEAEEIRIKDKVLILFSFVLTALMVIMGLYIGDGVANPYGASVVMGVQGRYFLMLIPLPFIALGSRKIQNNINRFEMKVTAIMGCMLGLGVMMLIQAYY